MKATIIIALSALLSGSLHAQIDNAKTETVKVFGNCGMCEETIENAGKERKLYKTEWNVDTKMATITYNSKKTTLDEVLKNIALAGYDNTKYLAPDEVYAQLHGCCKYERENKSLAKVEHSGPLNSHSVDTRVDHKPGNNVQAAAQTDSLQPLFAGYFNLKDALVKSDAAAARKSAAMLLEQMKGVKMGSLKDNDHTVWMKIRTDLKAKIESINESNDLDVQRNSFISLSQYMYELIKSNQPKGTVYYQFCPMANDGKGANWLSKESSIKNPYYGSEMLTCGKTVETIKD